MQQSDSAMIRVWDPLVRIGHWTLVATFAVAYLTDDDLMRLHAWTGYAVGAIVVLRVLWGFLGPRRARFADFIYGPRAVIAYARDLLAFRARRYIGHSPAGGVMIVALLAMLAATVYSGLMVYALEENRGPLAAIVAQAPAQVIPAAAADDNGEEEEEEEEEEEGEEAEEDEARSEFWKDLHETLSNATLILIILHIGGVALASFAHRENLVRAMITGTKHPEAEE